MASLPLDTSQDSSDIVGRTPSVLKNIQAQLPCGVYVGVEHLADELDLRRLVRVLLFELHDESESAILEWGVGGTDNDGVPIGKAMSTQAGGRRRSMAATYHVMTLSGTGDADTPAGGSVCIRCSHDQHWNHGWKLYGIRSNLKVSHQATTCGGGHDDRWIGGERWGEA